MHRVWLARLRWATVSFSAPSSELLDTEGEAGLISACRSGQ